MESCLKAYAVCDVHVSIIECVFPAPSSDSCHSPGISFLSLAVRLSCRRWGKGLIGRSRRWRCCCITRTTCGGYVAHCRSNTWVMLIRECSWHARDECKRRNTLAGKVGRPLRSLRFAASRGSSPSMYSTNCVIRTKK